MTHLLDERPAVTAPRRRTSPRRRPPRSIRAFAALLGASMLLVNVTLLLSDSAPGVLERVFGDFARRLWNRVDAGARTSISADRVPESDFFVHLTVWAIAAVLVGIAIWTWRGLAVGAAAVFASSVAIELAQGRYSASRVVERNDAIANATGVMIGTVAVAGCYLLWSAIAAALEPRRDHSA